MSLGDLVLLSVVFIIANIAERLEESPGGNYTCPSYCDVDHICYIEQDTIKTKGDINGLGIKQLDNVHRYFLDVRKGGENYTISLR